MGQVIAFGDFRREKLKAKLFSFAESQYPAVVETQTAVISAMRIFCRDHFAVLIDKFGYQTSIDYGCITDVNPMLPIADIVSPAKSQIFEEAPKSAAHVVVSFKGPSIRS